MGLLTDDDPPVAQGEGQKFLDTFAALDADDREKIRVWVEQGRGITYVRGKLSAVGFHMGYRTVQAGIRRLKAAGWES